MVSEGQTTLEVGDLVAKWNKDGMRGTVVARIEEPAVTTSPQSYPQVVVAWEDASDRGPWWVGNVALIDKHKVMRGDDRVVVDTWPGEPDAEGKAQGLSPFQEGVVDTLRSAADLFAERGQVYRDNYKRVGQTMMALFPDGLPVLRTAEDVDRWHLFELAVVKLTRYAVNYDMGHVDSLDDMIVYLAMVRQLDQQADRA